jgi:predicted Zn-dependent protease
MLRETEALLAAARGGASLSGDMWLVKAKLALTRAQDGEADQLATALAAFDMADRLRPKDADALTPWGIALLSSGQPTRAREMAERVLRTNQRDWLAWAVLACASAQLGDGAKEKEAAAEARRFVPP